MANTTYDYSKLLGRIRERRLTQDRVAEMISISPASMNQKLGNKRPFKQDEIMLMCEALAIPYSEIPEYFFCR